MIESICRHQRDGHQHHSNGHGDAAEDLRTHGIGMSYVGEGTGDGRPDQHAHRGRRPAHAQPRADDVEAGAKRRVGGAGGGRRDDDPGEEAPGDGPGHHAGRRADRRPAEQQHDADRLPEYEDPDGGGADRAAAAAG